MQAWMRRAAGGSAAGDGELLDAFRTRGDADALAELIERHGPMIRGVCRRAAANPADADDAFQATIVVLLRHAGSIRPAGSVGGWLFGVARRTALAANVAGARRRRLLGEFARTRPESVACDDIERDEVRELVDREVERLPDAYRAAVVACDLQGRSRAEAASRLGWPEGTLSCRLARARKLLATRLVRAGVAPAVAATAVTADAAPLTPDLRQSLTAIIDDPPGATESVRRLADLASAAMSRRLLRAALALTLVLGVGAALAGALSPDEPPKPAGPPPAAKPPAKPDPGWRLILERGEKRFALDLADRSVTEVPVSTASIPDHPDPLAVESTVSHATSPDGKRVVYETTHPKLGKRNGMIAVADADGKNHRKLTAGKSSFNPAWSPDGKRIVFVSDRAHGQWHLFEIAPDAKADDARQVSPDIVPWNCRPCFAADGRIVHTVENGSKPKAPSLDLAITGRVKETVVSKQFVIDFRTSPDGTKLAYLLPGVLVVRDLKSGRESRLEVEDVRRGWAVTFYALLWRPDGGALALSMGFLGGRSEGATIEGEDHVVVATLGPAKPAARAYRLGTPSGLYAWTTAEELKGRRK